MASTDDPDPRPAQPAPRRPQASLLPIAERLGRSALKLRGVESRMVTTSAGAMHLYDAPGTGKLPTIVILHGISSAATPYGRVILALRSASRRVIAPEYPGHGFSARPSGPLTTDLLSAGVIELLDRELDEPAIVFGNSLGGGVALTYALERPDRVRGLVLSSPAGARMDDDEWKTLLDTFRMASTAEARSFLTRLYHAPPWWTPIIARDVRALFSREVITQLTASVRPEHGFTAERLAELRMPILLLWGKSDQIMPRSNLEYFRRSLPPHTIIEEPGDFGHCPYLDQPTKLTAHIVDFARTLTGAGRSSS
jgi:pimeloyl-ACP methyl ester carboxylesterase